MLGVLAIIRPGIEVTVTIRCALAEFPVELVAV
jgi:hypothetical protein